MGLLLRLLWWWWSGTLPFAPPLLVGSPPLLVRVVDLLQPLAGKGDEWALGCGLDLAPQLEPAVQRRAGGGHHERLLP
jgi:hypothetical protein